jgi:hypothetical protein
MIATTTQDAAIAITLFVLVGALVIVIVWQIFSIVKKGMELRSRQDDDTRSGRHGPTSAR